MVIDTLDPTVPMTDLELIQNTLSFFTENPEMIAKNNRGCAYRAPDGRKCAAGRLIEDKKYRPELEGKIVYSYCVRSALPEWVNIDVLCSLQSIHDNLLALRMDGTFSGMSTGSIMHRIDMLFGAASPSGGIDSIYLGVIELE